MFDTHTTEDGEKILICHMEDSHLFNTIRMHTRKIREARAVLEQSTAGSSIYEALGVNPVGMSRADAQRQIRNRHSLLPPYVMEATLRGLAIRGLLASAYGRDALIPRPVPALPSADSDWRPVEVVSDDDDDDDDDDGYYPYTDGSF